MRDNNEFLLAVHLEKHCLAISDNTKRWRMLIFRAAASIKNKPEEVNCYIEHGVLLI